MKKQTIPAILIFILALVIGIGSQTFLSPCLHEDGAHGVCHPAGQALLGLGCALGILALFALAIPRAGFGVYLSALPVCGLGILTPGTLMELCHMSTMRCRMVMQPAMIILFCVALASAVIGAILTRRKQ